MRLLVSVANAAEARAALEGGADIVDAKEPARGPLGAVDVSALRDIVRVVDGRLPVSAALGDASDEAAIAVASRRAVSERVAYVKVGFAGISDAERVESLIAAAVHGSSLASGSAGVIAVAYADYSQHEVATLSPCWLVEAAERGGAVGVLLDTARKDSTVGADGRLSAVFRAMPEGQVAAWVRQAHQADLTVGVAGGLAGADLPLLRSLGVDVAGVRGAACEGGDRLRPVSAGRVAALARHAGRRSWLRAHAARPVEAAARERVRSPAALP